MSEQKLVDLKKLEDLLKKLKLTVEKEDIDNLLEIVKNVDSKKTADRTVVDDVLILHGTRNILDIPKADTKFDYSPLHAQAAKFGLSLSAVCSATGISNSVRKMINNGEPIHMNHLSKIALLLECEVQDLFKQIPTSDYQRMMNKGYIINENAKLFALVLDQMLGPVSEDATEKILSVSSINLSDQFDDLNLIREVLDMPAYGKNVKEEK